MFEKMAFYNLYLFYGENEGYKNEIIKNKFEKLYPNQIYKYDEKEVLENYIKAQELFNKIESLQFIKTHSSLLKGFTNYKNTSMLINMGVSTFSKT